MKAEWPRPKKAGVNSRTFGRRPTSFDKLRKSCFRTYGKTGQGEKRYYLHSPEGSREHNGAGSWHQAWIPVSSPPGSRFFPDTELAVSTKACTVAWCRGL